jgi:hypothetical protein
MDQDADKVKSFDNFAGSIGNNGDNDYYYAKDPMES